MKAGWEEKKLGEVCDVIAGQSPESKYYNDNGIGLPFYQGKIEFREKYINSPKVWTSKITKEAFDGDILMSVRAPVGPVNFATQKICIGRGLSAIRATKNIDKEFIFYFLRHNENRIKGKKGAVFNSINKNQIENIEIPLPPLSEQKQIVKVLDELFERIEKAKANINKNVENAEEMFQSKLNEILSKNDDGWVDKELARFSKIMYGYTAVSSDNKIGPKYLRITDIQNNSVNWSDVPYCQISDSDYTKYKLKIGDIVFARTGATTGKSFLIENDRDSVFASYLIRVQADNNIIYSDYLYYYFQSYRYWKSIESGISGSTQGGFNAKKLSSLKIPLPPLSEQKKIVASLNEFSAKTSDLKDKYTQKLIALDELKKTALEKAFRGELT